MFHQLYNYLTGRDDKQQYLELIRNENRRSNIMTITRIQPCHRKVGSEIGSYNGKGIWH